MPKLADRLRLLKPDRRAAADVLAVALDHADPGEAVAIARAVASTRLPVALASVVRNLHRIDASAQSEVVAAGPVDGWRRAIRSVMRGGGERADANVTRVIDLRRDPLLAPELPPLLQARAPTAADAAAVLVRLTESVVGPTGRRRSPAAAHDAMDEALARALEQYRAHRRSEVLTAAALMTERPGPALRRVMEREDDTVVRALRTIAERMDDPYVRANILRWLGNPWLSRSAARWLHRLRTGSAFGVALSNGHLLHAPKRRRALDRAERPLQCVPAADLAAEMPARSQANLPLLIGRLGMSSRARVRHLAELRTLPSPVARLRAVTALLAENGPRAAEAVGNFCSDPDPAVAGLAVRDVLARTDPDPDLLRRIERSPHRALAHRARRRLAQEEVDDFRALGSGLGEPHRWAAVLRLRATRPTALREELQRAMREGNATERVKAMMIARRVGLVAGIEETLIELTEHDDPTTASTALASLATGRSPRRLAVLMAALRHDDPRAQANAVESLDRAARRAEGGRQIVEVIAPLTRSDSNRSRANAIRAVLRMDSTRGRADLHDMLRDANPLHRVSAIWVARHEPAAEVAEDLQELAAGDSRVTVRERARTALRLIDRRRPTPAWVHAHAHAPAELTSTG